MNAAHLSHLLLYIWNSCPRHPHIQSKICAVYIFYGRQGYIDDALALLTDKQRTIIVRRYGLADDAETGLTFQAIADILDVSKQYVQQVEAISIQKLASSHLTGKQA